jgi:hypothetical protein
MTYSNVLLLRSELAEEITEVERCLDRYPQDLPVAVGRLIDAVRHYERVTLPVIQDATVWHFLTKEDSHG